MYIIRYGRRRSLRIFGGLSLVQAHESQKWWVAVAFGNHCANTDQRDDEKDPSTIMYEQSGLELVPQVPPLPPKTSNGNVFAAELPGTQGGYQHYQPQPHTVQQTTVCALKLGAPAVQVYELPPRTPGFLSDSNRHTGDFDRALPPPDVSKKRYCGLPKRILIGVIELLSFSSQLS